MQLELADPTLWQIVENRIDEDFGEGTTKRILGNKAPVVITGEIAKSLFLIPYEWMKVVDQDFNDYEVHHLGLWIGDLVEDRFRLSLAILDQLASFTDNILIVKNRSAESFTYGRSIIKEGVVKLNQTLSRGQRVIVLDEDMHVVGLASLAIDANKLPRLSKEKLVAKNLLDIGWYLRRMG